MYLILNAQPVDVLFNAVVPTAEKLCPIDFCLTQGNMELCKDVIFVILIEPWFSIIVLQ